MRRALLLATLAVLPACGEPEPEGPPEGVDSVQYALSTIDCTKHKDTGYVNGKPFEITLVTVDGKRVQIDTANAYYVMAKAASAKGVNLKVVSGFRTMAEQTYFYNCYIHCNCNNCNLAAKPGYSNHQSGHALDLNSSASGVLSWLRAHAGTYGFKNTVASEDWHWEWWSGGPGGGPCVDQPADMARPADLVKPVDKAGPRDLVPGPDQVVPPFDFRAVTVDQAGQAVVDASVPPDAVTPADEAQAAPDDLAVTTSDGRRPADQALARDASSPDLGSPDGAGGGGVDGGCQCRSGGRSAPLDGGPALVIALVAVLRLARRRQA